MRAFTLVEALVAGLISIILSAGIIMFLNIADTTYQTDLVLLDLHQQARQAIGYMRRELREAVEKSISTDGGRVTFNTPALSNVQYYRDTGNNQAIREYPFGTLRILGSNVGALSFCCWNPQLTICDTSCSGSDLLEITLWTAKTVKGRALNFSFKERVRLRNE